MKKKATYANSRFIAGPAAMTAMRTQIGFEGNSQSAPDDFSAPTSAMPATFT